MLRPIRPYLLCILALSTCVLAKDKPELTQFGHDIRVEPGESVADLTCINCSIYVAGESAGEATAIHGNIILEAGGSIAGDVTAVWGDVRMQPGGVRRSTGSSIAGDVTSLEGTKWLLAIILPPIFITGLIVALIIWLVQRSRRPARVSQPYLAAR